jgi:hypothetical protein
VSDIASLDEKVKPEAATEVEILWGAGPIGAEINRNPRQTSYLLDRGLIKSARKVGGLWCANRTALRREFGAL